NAHMVDISAKPATERVAIAVGAVTMQPETLQRIMDGGIKKGDVLSVARLAGIM
ncbi:MAG TPA: cyclic pyranopterin monophosphate synthase MoaC, partial [Alphaproteobacteria bacterium]|nr:cyclic pyranopterin monophosphate synthase MoaC [Alphaproteobacteria bacterium]